MTKFSAMSLTAILAAMSLSVAAYGADGSNLTVTLDSSDQLVYSGGTQTDGSEYVLADGFSDVLPGQTVTEAITIANDNGHTASFYVSEETLKTMEEANGASGGAYTLKLSVGDSEETATEVVTSVAGGYKNGESSTKGLSDITELEGYNYLAELDSGEQTNVYLTLTLEGEGMDSTDSSDYTEALAQLSMKFRAYYQDDDAYVVNTTETVVQDKVVTVANNDDDEDEDVVKVVTITDAAKTSDMAPIAAIVVCLGAGLGLILVGSRKEKEGDDHE
ncbi:MAG: hypothetical protein K5840_08335 [Eubacterium sp.]|nr:hypothetical protein [Eubacterium sp.]